MKICRCCGYSLRSEELKCPRCRCQYVNALDEKAEQREVRRCQNMRTNIIIPKIKEISVNAYEYQMCDSGKKMESKGRKKIILADGSKCCNGIYWAPMTFGQWLYSEKLQKLDISYKYDGVERVIHAKIKPVKCDDYWRVGLHIDDKLMLWIYVGNEKKNSKAGPYEINLGK